MANFCGRRSGLRGDQLLHEDQYQPLVGALPANLAVGELVVELQVACAFMGGRAR